MRRKVSTRTTCLVEMKNGAKCKKQKQPNQLSCTEHWNQIPSDLQYEVYAGYHEQIDGTKHRTAILKCYKIWSNNDPL